MRHSRVRILVTAITTTLGITLLAGCSSSGVAGTGSANLPAGVTVPRVTTSPSDAGKPQPEKTETITANDASASYHMTLWAHDHITDCRAHSYGTAVPAYFAKYPCGGADRTLWTLPLNGRTVLLSIISVHCATGTGNDTYGPTATFAKVENGDNDSGVKDLLLEGHRVPGAPNSFPSDETFEVLSQDVVVSIFDAWYLTGPNNADDPTLAKLAQRLFLTKATGANP